MPPAPLPDLPFAPTPSLQWDVFCRVVDNYGDIGVCWRLAADLGRRGHRVRLWVDDASALRWMAPDGAVGVSVLPWTHDAAMPAPGDVVIETFGCELPPAFVERMAAAARPPVWVNLEYLSAESYVERSHRLRSPQRNGLDKWFFYPGFTPATGGLLREPGLLERLDEVDRCTELAAFGVAPRPGERVVSVFCYPGAALDLLCQGPPSLLLTAPGAATEWAARTALPVGLRHHALPWLTQPAYDRLLHACDLNLVRGEDSFVRAQWAGRPFVWQIYPQHDGVHEGKLEAFLGLLLHSAEAPLASTVRGCMRAWNGLQGEPGGAWPEPSAWARLAAQWRKDLAAQPDLVTQLLGFVAEKR